MLWGNNVLKVEVTKPCSKCGIVQPLSEYSIARKNDDGTYGYRSDCKTCTKKLDKIRKKIKKEKMRKEESKTIFHLHKPLCRQKTENEIH